MARRPLQRVQAALVARRFYLQKQSKSQIADELGISRFKVARLIETAIDEGIIQFVINDEADLDAELAEAVRRKYKLKAALVLDGPDLPASALIEPLGVLGADFLKEVLSDGQSLGVAWGRTLAATARNLAWLPKVDVIQAAGSPAGLDFSQSPVDLVHRFASVSGGRAFPLFGPMWAEDPKLIQGLREEPSIASVLSRYDTLDVLLIGIGSWNPAESCLCSGFPNSWREIALANGVCADLCATLIDKQGRAVPNLLDELGLSITTAQLRRIPEVIGIAGGLEKADSILAALRGGWLSILVTDGGVARRLMAAK
jgi:DNA-binding transcriptional regulator LsrR (DeoR family)